MFMDKIAYGMLGAGAVKAAFHIARGIAVKKHDRYLNDVERDIRANEEYQENAKLIDELKEINLDLMSWSNKETA